MGVLLCSGGTRAILRWKPFSVTSFGMLQALKALGVEPRFIVDAGANIGQFARAAAETYPEARIVAFEPLPEVAAKLRANLGDCKRVDVRAAAVGSESGTVTICRNEYSPASSILRLRSDAADAFDLREGARVDVPLVTLDDELGGLELEQPVLVKLDLQGYELEALRGATATLARTRYVLVEIGLRPMYEDEPSFDDVYSFLTSAGFRLMSPLSSLRDGHGRVSQMDALFERAGEDPPWRQ
jgi:FkbM family methyltransferase